MHRLICWVAALGIGQGVCGACAGPEVHPVLSMPPMGEVGDELITLPTEMDTRLRRVFRQVTGVRTPMGRPILIFVQRGVIPAKAMVVRDVLDELLTPSGDNDLIDRAAAAEAIADTSRAVMVFRSGRSVPRAKLDELATAGFVGVEITADTIALPGEPRESKIEGDGAVRAILRFVLEFGIAPTHPDLGEMIDAGVGRDALIDAAMAYWGLDATTSRAELTEHSAGTARLVERIVTPFRRSAARVYPGARGHITLAGDPDRPVTRRWRWYASAQMSGRSDTDLTGNAADNTLGGNFGDNAITGLGGDDTIDGGLGDDMAVYRGPIGDYHITIEDGVLYVLDLAPDRDGSDTLTNIEVLRFTDAEVDTTKPGTP